MRTFQSKSLNAERVLAMIGMDLKACMAAGSNVSPNARNM